MNVLVRFATVDDADWCHSRDGLVSRDLVRRKISQHELVVVEAGGAAWATIGLLRTLSR